MPWDERAWDTKGVMQLSKQLTDLNNIAQKYEMQIGFHKCIIGSLNNLKNATYWDAIASNTPTNSRLQLDIGWVHYVGKEPLYFVKEIR